MYSLLLLSFALAADTWVAPTVSVRDLAATGALSADQAWAGVQAVEPLVLGCFARTDAPVPASIGSVELGWVVSPEGRAGAISLRGAEAAPTLENCLVSALTDAQFATSSGETRVSGKLQLAPTSPQADHLARIVATPAASAGVLGALSDSQMSGIGGLIGAKGTQLGSGGLGARGSGLGGGGTAEGLGGLGRPRAPQPATRVVVEQASGDVVVSDVQSALGAWQSALDDCYTTSLKTRTGTRGVITTSLKFGKDGAPKKVKVEDDTTSNPELTTCVQGVLKQVNPGKSGTAQVAVWVSETSGWGSGGIGTLGGDPIILGALDKSLIDAVIKRYMNQIRYCYQRELTKNPGLAGKITVKFVIAKDGTVSSALTKSTTMNNSAVEDCINGRFMKMQFPEPKGGGIVIVSYPFVFTPN